ncbi:unnamed protein product (macronuclear) [Paramecium tetraurelia]|uniref:Transmembrane protein n=1 Tax=Paramecium tetraurelia TaxID=5888 RepID=A0DLX5_PARTE|nr:uncharacterized protein GSPATT00018260001 [Paramecium tetraurelia]CAK84042.1 unnamed protein product [Paramecium tetraurelia]|eukprot:XP_001451439.1 hypothetical protein (macronuclear) [Paramecium tetraurelia strain d4-2]
MLKLITRGYQFARQTKQAKQNKQTQENKESDEKMKKMQQLILKLLMLQINTQTLLAIALFQVLQPKFQKIQLQSIAIFNQAQQNKDLRSLVKDKNSEFMKQVLELQNSIAPNTIINNDEKSSSQVKQKKKK